MSLLWYMLAFLFEGVLIAADLERYRWIYLWIVPSGWFATLVYLIARRLHDLDRPAEQAWLLLLPLYNIYFGALLIFERGTVGPNQYGPDPLAPESSKGA